MRIVFLGTPSFAVPTLEALLTGGYEIAAVCTQPDRPQGRGQEMGVSPVKECALRHGLEVRQPPRIRHPEVVEQLRDLQAKAMVIVGYGQIIPQSIIDLPELGIINVHASLLPKYRGAAPIQWAIARGERVTGVTTMRIDAGLDTGEMLMREETEIGPEETALELGPRLAEMGAELLLRTLAELEDGSLIGEPQDNELATLAPILKREDGLVDWNRPAAETHCRARGFLPWPGAWTYFRGQRFNIWCCRLADLASNSAPGTMFVSGKRLYVACGAGVLELLEVQIEGRKRLRAAEFLNGVRLEEGLRLGENRS